MTAVRSRPWASGTTPGAAGPRGRATRAIRLRPRTVLALAMASFVGVVAFAWPLVVAPGRAGSATTAPLLFGVLLALVVAVVLAELVDGGIDAKAIGVLGVLSALGAVLRPLGAGTAGIETVFFTLVLAGRVFGPGFGFALGTTTMLSSAVLTAGVGPWLPYQMLGAAWVGLGAGLLPRCRGRKEVALLAGYGAVSAYLYGLAINLSFWPFSVSAASTISYRPGAPLAEQVHRYLVFDATTSLGWDTGRAITNLALIVVLGTPALRSFRRAARRAAFEAPVTFAPRDGVG